MKMKSISLKAGVAVAALMIGAPAAFAQVAITQDSTNGATVSNFGATSADPNTIGISFNAAVPGMGIGASGSISASGAVSSVSATAINQDFITPTIGTVTQGAGNTAAIGNTGTLTIGTGSTSAGSSASVGATGAAAAVSITGIGDGAASGTFTGQTVGNIAQGGASHLVTNSGTITNIGLIDASGLTMAGNGSSASVSATGAVASVSVASIGATSFGANGISNGLGGGTAVQTVTNTGDISNTSGATGLTPSAGITIGDLTGKGASVSVGATGSAASISVASIDSNSVAGTTFGGITQQSTNGTVGGAPTVQNTGNIAVGDLGGVGAGAQINATGASSSLSVSSIKNDTAAIVGTGITGQTTSNYGAITNSGIITSTGTVSGTGASASISAMGAASSFSANSNSDTAAGTPLTLGAITQTTTNNTGATVANTGAITVASGSMGQGASLSVSAIGAGSFASFRSVK